MTHDYIDINLSLNDAVDKYLMTSLDKSDLGTEPEIEDGNIRIFLGSRPIVFNLLDLYLKQKKEVPAEYNIFDQYDVWIVTYAVSVIKSGGWKKIQQIGLEIAYPDGQDDPKIIIINNMPVTYFKKLATGNFQFSAGLKLDGHVDAKIDEIKIQEYLNLGFGGRLGVSNEEKIGFDITFNLLTTKIISIGVGDTHGEWVLHRDETPLLGDQLFSQTVLTPKGIEHLGVKARVNTVISGALGNFPVKMKGHWNELSLF